MQFCKHLDKGCVKLPLLYCDYIAINVGPFMRVAVGAILIQLPEGLYTSCMAFQFPDGITPDNHGPCAKHGF